MLHKAPGILLPSDHLLDRISPLLPYLNVPAILFLFSSTCIIIIKTLMPWFFYRPGNIPFQFINSAPKSNNIQIILFCKLIQRKRFTKRILFAITFASSKFIPALIITPLKVGLLNQFDTFF